MDPASFPLLVLLVVALALQAERARPEARTVATTATVRCHRGGRCKVLITLLHV
jgi:hypothetical protein